MRIKWRGRCKTGLGRAKTRGGTTNSKGPLNDHVKTSYCRNFLNKYIDERNLSGITKSRKR